MDSTAARQSAYNNTIYYGVHTPNDNKEINVQANVFQDKDEALKLAKKNKKSRFKAFQFFHEAAEFALNGLECPNNNTTVDGPLFQTRGTNDPSQNIGAEKGSPFKGPKSQELVELRKAIENGNYKQVHEMIWQNPRYLVSSGDTPSILQEGARYNALHVAAKCKNVAIVELILNTISNVEFIKLLYGDDNTENARERAKILLDLYLNTPNKGVNETPLHFAAKHGAVDVVEVLVTYPQCDRTLRNKYDKTADQMICERDDNTTPANARKRIALLLEDSYYVPVLRTEDNSLPPLVGEPFSPISPPVLNNNPLSPTLEIHAYAGPMNKQNAQNFRKVWKTPPRSLRTDQSDFSLRFKDPEKGLERIGKKLANEFDVTWKEYWPFLNCFVDITSEEGLTMLEQHLGEKERQLLSEHYGKSPLVNILSLDHMWQHQNSRKSDYSMKGSESDNSLGSLCSAFRACNLNDSTKNECDLFDGRSELLTPFLHIEKACQVFANRIYKDILYMRTEYNNVAAVLETEIKQLELLITSYMEDHRFGNVNFQKVHPRLGYLVGRMLHKAVQDEERLQLHENLRDSISKSVDCFSSDDEGNHFRDTLEQKKPTVYKKQIVCFVHYVSAVLMQPHGELLDNNVLNETQCGKEWGLMEECNCVYHLRKSKRSSLSRNSSIKYNKFYLRHNDSDIVARKLFFNECDVVKDLPIINVNGIHVNLSSSLEESSSSDDDFFTPPSSPSILCSDSEDEFDDSQIPKYEVFIEGSCPTKTDYTVYNALKLQDEVLTDKKYPHIYKWRHNLMLYQDSEKESWPSPRHLTFKVPQKQAKSPSEFSYVHHLTPASCSTPTKSWTRITGPNSPRAIFNNRTNSVKHF